MYLKLSQVGNIKYILIIFFIFFVPLKQWYDVAEDAADGPTKIHRALENGALYSNNKVIPMPFFIDLEQDAFVNHVLFFCKTCQVYQNAIDDIFERAKDHPEFQKQNRHYLQRFSFNFLTMFQLFSISAFVFLYYFAYVKFSWNLPFALIPFFLIIVIFDIEDKGFSMNFWAYTLFYLMCLGYRGNKSEDIPFWKSKVFYSLATFIFLYFSARIIYLRSHSMNIDSLMIIEGIYLLFFYFIYYLASRALFLAVKAKDAKPMLK